MARRSKSAFDGVTLSGVAGLASLKTPKSVALVAVLGTGEQRGKMRLEEIVEAAPAGAPGRPGGKTPNLDQFTTNLTERARAGQLGHERGGDLFAGGCERVDLAQAAGADGVLMTSASPDGPMFFCAPA